MSTAMNLVFCIFLGDGDAGGVVAGGASLDGKLQGIDSRFRVPGIYHHKDGLVHSHPDNLRGFHKVFSVVELPGQIERVLVIRDF